LGRFSSSVGRNPGDRTFEEQKMTRTCARPGCSEPATATFGYDYVNRTVWIDTVAEEPHPSTYDLCRRHAAGMTVPNGWELRDGRAQAAALFRAS
jgi:hypothetical protein